MSEPFLTKIIIYLILIFLVWEQLGPDELKSLTAAQLLPEQEVSSLKRIARKLMIVDIDEFNAFLCIKKNVSQPAPDPPECSDQRKSEVRCANRPINALSFITKINCTCYPRDSNSSICHVKELNLTETKQSLKPSSSCDFSSFLIDLSYNHLNGSIPENLGNLKFLSDLILDGNLLNGTIPISLSKITYLGRLSVTDNQLSGQIPKELGLLKFLKQLWLDSNNFTGQLPTTFSQLKKLEDLCVFRGPYKM